MKSIIKVGTLLLLPMLAVGVQAEVTQDCVVEGKVKQRSGQENGTNVYVAFHSVKKSNEQTNCSIDRQKRVAFKQPKNAMIEHAPVGSTVTYRYVEQDNNDGQWSLVTVGM
ncbi:MAG: putative acyltransferase (DUF342 family) [Halioglobus sp.]|jgi:predicted acyltransferase (DUF342 family)